MHSYGEIAHIDLSQRKVWREPAEPYYRDIGGRGRNVALLRRLVPGGTDPLGPDNVLLFGTGPVTGTIAPSSARYNVSARSPLTGFLGDSNSGGHWALELKYAGYEGLVIYGQSEKPVYLWIHNDKIEIRDAAELWGRDTIQTTHDIRRQLRDPDVAVASIGPAGERLVRFASVINDNGRAAGRTGMGAVMGSKQLKAIAVRGTRGVSVAHPKEYFEACRRITKTILGGRQFELYKMSGVVGHRGKEDYSDDDPIVNLIFNPPMPEWGEIGGKEWWRTHWTKRKACAGCQMHCSHFYNVRQGPFAGTMGEGPDQESQAWLTVLVGNSRKDLAAYGNNYLNRVGMDTIEMGAIIRGVMRCYENGVLTDKKLKQLGARWLRPHWGDIETVMALLELTANRKGFGDILAEGGDPTAEAIGGDAAFWMATCKHQLEINRSPQKGGVLNHMVATRGIDHLRGSPSLEFYGFTGDDKIYNDWVKYVGKPELFRHATQLLSYQGKPELVVWQEHLRALSDSFGVCSFNYGNWPNTSIYPDDFAELFSLSTGIEVSAEDMVASAERIIANERAFNIFQGWRREDDQPPRLWVEEKKKAGMYQGDSTDSVEFNKMLDEYYARRGYDPQTGLPGREKLNLLGLSDLANDLAAIDKLAEDAPAQNDYTADYAPAREMPRGSGVYKTAD